MIEGNAIYFATHSLFFVIAVESYNILKRSQTIRICFFKIRFWE